LHLLNLLICLLLGHRREFRYALVGGRIVFRCRRCGRVFERRMKCARER